MFDNLDDAEFLGDLRYLFKKFDDAKQVYRRDIEKSNKVANEVTMYNKNFSDTFFTSWLRNIFLRYTFLISSKDTQKTARFEKIHIYEKQNDISKDTLSLYSIFKFVNINYIDLLEFNHNPSYDVLLLKMSVTCTGIIGKEKSDSPVEEQRSFYYDIEFVKDNDKSNNEKMENFTSNCPNCGAPTNISTFGVCDHCKEIVSIYDNVWKIRKLKLDD